MAYIELVDRPIAQYEEDSAEEESESSSVDAAVEGETAETKA